MKRKDAILQDCRNKVAKSMRFESWNQLIRFKSKDARYKLNKVVESFYNIEMPLLFCNWYCAKIWQGKSVKRTIEKADLEEFLNQEI